MSDDVKIKENPDLIREKGSHAVINSNVNAYKQARELRAKRLSDAQRIDVLEAKMDKILEILEGKK